jgi:hypothetical protein
VGSPTQRKRARTLLADTRRALYQILAEDAHEADDEPEPREV